MTCDLTQLANLGEFVGGSSSAGKPESWTSPGCWTGNGTSPRSSPNHRGESEPDALSEREWVDFVNYALMRFGIWEAAFVNYRAGTVSEEV